MRGFAEKPSLQIDRHHTENQTVATTVAETVKMKASRLTIPGGQFPRCTESSSGKDPKRRSSKSTITSSKRKKSGEPSTSKSGNKCPPVLCRKGQAAEPDSFGHAVTNTDVHPTVHPWLSEDDQAANNLNLPDCPWPNWPDWGSETHSERGGAAGPRWASNFSYTSSSCSDSESDIRWSTSSSASGRTGGNRVHEATEVPRTCTFWEDFTWGERRHWKQLQHKKSFLTHLWDVKPETKVEESSDPILVSVNILGSPGPLRIVVDKNDSVQDTVDFVLRRYTAQKRLPAVVEPTSCFGLYCRNPDFEALDDEAKIGHRKSRQFHLYQKHRNDPTLEDIAINDLSSCKSGGETSPAPIRTWIWDSLTGMSSWGGNLIASISRSVTSCVKYWNPGRLYRFISIVSGKALSLVVI